MRNPNRNQGHKSVLACPAVVVPPLHTTNMKLSPVASLVSLSTLLRLGSDRGFAIALKSVFSRRPSRGAGASPLLLPVRAPLDAKNGQDTAARWWCAPHNEIAKASLSEHTRLEVATHITSTAGMIHQNPICSNQISRPSCSRRKSVKSSLRHLFVIPPPRCFIGCSFQRMLKLCWCNM